MASIDEWIKYREKYPFSEDKKDRFYPFYSDYRGYRGDFKQTGYNPDSQSTSIYHANLYTDGLTIPPYVPKNRLMQHLKDRFNTLNKRINDAIDDYEKIHLEATSLNYERAAIFDRIVYLEKLIPTLPEDQKRSYRYKVKELKHKLTDKTIELEKIRRLRASIHAHVYMYVTSYDKVGRSIAKELEEEKDVLYYQNEVMSMYRFYTSYSIDGTSMEIDNIQVDNLRTEIFLSNLHLEALNDTNTKKSNELKLLDRELNNINHVIQGYESSGEDAPERLYLKQSSMYLEYEKLSNDLSVIKYNINTTKNKINSNLETVILHDKKTAYYLEMLYVDYEKIEDTTNIYYKTILDYIKDNRI